MDLTTTQLRMFVVVAEELNFTRAARRLFVTQPALSTAIRRLEAAVGHQLCNRSSRAVELTASGVVLLAHAQDILRSVSALEDDLAPERAIVRAGIAPTLVDVPRDLLDVMRREHPDIRVDVVPVTPRDSAVALRDGRLDLFVGGLPHESVRPTHRSEPLRLEAVLLARRPPPPGDRPLPGRLVVDDPATSVYPRWAELTTSYAEAVGAATVVRRIRPAPAHLAAQNTEPGELLPILASQAPPFTDNGVEVLCPTPMQPYFTWWMTWQEPRGRGRRRAVATLVGCARAMSAERNWLQADPGLPGVPWLGHTDRADRLDQVRAAWTAGRVPAKPAPYPTVTVGHGAPAANGVRRVNDEVGSGTRPSAVSQS